MNLSLADFHVNVKIHNFLPPRSTASVRFAYKRNRGAYRNVVICYYEPIDDRISTLCIKKSSTGFINSCSKGFLIDIIVFYYTFPPPLFSCIRIRASRRDGKRPKDGGGVLVNLSPSLTTILCLHFIAF